MVALPQWQNVIDWIDHYIDSLSDSDKQDVVIKSSDMVLKFAVGEKLPPLKRIIIPCYLAGKK